MLRQQHLKSCQVTTEIKSKKYYKQTGIIYWLYIYIYILWLYIDIWKMNKICYFSCYSKAEFSAVITAFFSVTWSFRNYYNMLLCCLRDNSYYIHYYNQCQNSFVLFSGLFVERTAEIKSFWNTDNIFPVSFEWLCLTMALSCYKFTVKHSLYN